MEELMHISQYQTTRILKARAIRFISNKSSISIEPELEKERHKVDDAVTADKKHSNDIQRSEEEDKQQ
jgi:hypothetical protein